MNSSHAAYRGALQGVYRTRHNSIHAFIAACLCRDLQRYSVSPGLEHLEDWGYPRPVDSRILQSLAARILGAPLMPILI